MTTVVHPLYTLLQAERQFLLPHWRHRAVELLQVHTRLAAAPHATPDRGMCGFTVAFLQQVLKAQGHTLRIAGGSPWPPAYPTGGFLADDGQWYGHYWLTDGRAIFDITATQFGAEEVVITTVDDPRYQENFSRKEIQAQLLRVRTTLKRWQTQRQGSVSPK